jgi:hypothetical protein
MRVTAGASTACVTLTTAQNYAEIGMPWPHHPASDKRLLHRLFHRRFHRHVIFKN